MVGNPFTAERQQQLTNDAKEVLEEFSLQFLKSYAFALFNKIKDDIKGEEADPRRLKYRDWNDVPRQLFSGPCYMKTGMGAGDFSGWKKVFIAETQDYNIQVYPNEKTYQDGKKPKKTIPVAGYSLTRNVTNHYKSEMRYVAAGLGLTDIEVTALTLFSNYSFALTHGQRTNYIFQLHAESGGGCFPCMSAAIDPNGGEEMAEDREKYLEAFDRCVNNASARGDSVLSKAFDDTVTKLSGKLSNLYGWTDDGTESEILTDMLLAQCVPALRDGMLQDLVGPVSIRLALWYKVQGLMNKSLQALVRPTWIAMEKGAAKVGNKIEPIIRQGIEPIIAALEKAKGQIRSSVSDKVGDVLGKVLSPHLKPIFTCLDAPMNKGFQLARALFDMKVQMETLPDDADKRDAMLDSLPRSYANTCEMQKASYDLVEPLWNLKNISSEIFGDIDPYALRIQAEATLLMTLDAAIYTLEKKIKEEDKSDAHKAAILADFDHDVVLAKATFTKDVMRSLLVANFVKLCSPIVDPVIATADGVIPADLHDIVSAQAAWDELVELLIAQPIDKSRIIFLPPSTPCLFICLF